MHRLPGACLAAVGCLAWIACSAPPPIPTPAPSPAPTAPVSTAAPTASATTTPPPSEQLKFASVAELPPVPEHGSHGRLFVAGDTLWLSIDSPMRHGVALYAFDGKNTFVEKKEMFVSHVDATMLSVNHVFDAGSGNLVLVDTEAGGAIPHVHHRVSNQGGAWKVEETLAGYRPLGLVQRDGATFTLMSHFMSHASGFPPTWHALVGKAPKLEFASGSKCPGDEPKSTLLDHEAVASAPNGTVVSYGLSCGKNPAVEIWQAGSTKPRVAELPATSNTLSHASDIHATDSEVRVVGAAYWRLQKGQWNVVALPKGHEAIYGARFAPDGTLYAALDGGGLYRHAGKTWTRIEAPASTSSITIGADGKVWALSNTALLALTAR